MKIKASKLTRMKPRLFRKRPSTVEAMQWDGSRESARKIGEWFGGGVNAAPGGKLYVPNFMLCTGDWLVRGAGDDFYPVKAERFNDLFEPVIED